MDPLWITILTIVGSVAASSGFWAWLQRRGEKNDTGAKLLLGIAHDRIMFLSLQYIDRGSITIDQFENLVKYLYEPYKQRGGNGTIDKLMIDVKKLPLITDTHISV